MVVVNSVMIETFYEIGTIINERKEWGNSYIERLANDLKEYGECYSIRNLHYMAQFAESFTSDEISSQGLNQFPWSLMIIIMEQCKSHNERLWYVLACKKNGWEADMLLKQIEMKAYERSFN